MKIDFYGVKAPAPSPETIEAFGGQGEPELLAGGQSTSYRSGDIVLKPMEVSGGDNWIGQIFSGLPESTEVRFARPIKTPQGHWFHNGYEAWSYLAGSHVKGHYKEKLKASLAFHTLLKKIPKPAALDVAANSWAAASLVVLKNRPYDYGPEFQELIDHILPHLKPLKLPNQLIHGDLSGNFLLAEGLTPAIIDFSPAWAPAGFAEGIMLADVIAWEDALRDELKPFKMVPHIEQLAWRGVFRRIAEQAEHMKWFKKSKNQALEEARVFEKVIEYLNAEFVA